MGIGTGPEQWLITATVDGQPAGTWDTFEGGDGDSESRIYHRGDGALVSRGGKQTFDEATITRLWDGDRARFVALMDRRGKAPMSITATERDADGNPVTTGVTYTGTLKKVGRGGANSDGDGDVMLSLTMTVAGAA